MDRPTAFVAFCALVLPLAVAACGPGEQQAETAAEGEAAAESPGATPAGIQDSPEKEAIRRMARDYEAALAAGDFDRFLAFFTEDVVVYPPDEPAVVGKEAFRAWSRPYFEGFELEETITYEGLKLAGDWGVGWYRYTFSTTPKDGGETATEEGKGVLILRRQPDSSWKWSLSAWSRNEPPPREP